MRTHTLAEILRKAASNDAMPTADHVDELRSAATRLAEMLSSAPNVPLSEVKLVKKADDVGVGLRSLMSLSRYTKQQWLELARDYQMHLQLNPRDSARDVLGKVLRYLEAHPDTVRSLGTKPKRTKVVDTSELENALAKLLDRNDG